MNAAVVVRLADVRRILGGECDPLRAVWDEQASLKDRRLLLAMAGVSVTDAAAWVRLSWCDLRASVRGDVARGLERFKKWAKKVTP